jgi:nicotinamide riboside transporter PnuC
MDWTWAITAGAIIGTVANINKCRWAFGVWLVTNSSWLIIDFRAGLYSQAFLFSVYVLLSIWGLYKWRHNCDS